MSAVVETVLPTFFSSVRPCPVHSIGVRHLLSQVSQKLQMFVLIVFRFKLVFALSFLPIDSSCLLLSAQIQDLLIMGLTVCTKHCGRHGDYIRGSGNNHSTIMRERLKEFQNVGP